MWWHLVSSHIEFSSTVVATTCNGKSYSDNKVLVEPPSLVSLFFGVPFLRKRVTAKSNVSIRLLGSHSDGQGRRDKEDVRG